MPLASWPTQQPTDMVRQQVKRERKPVQQPKTALNTPLLPQFSAWATGFLKPAEACKSWEIGKIKTVFCSCFILFRLMNEIAAIDIIEGIMSELKSYTIEIISTQMFNGNVEYLWKNREANLNCKLPERAHSLN
jgi:hypothetical protein